MTNRELITLVVIVIVVLCVFSFAFTWIGKANAFVNARDDQRLQQCQNAGYTYGECYNVQNLADRYKFTH